MPPIFSKQADRKLRTTLIALGLAAALVAGFLTYYFTPKYTRVGYQPEQPVPFSHKLHAGQLGLSCLYCHGGVEESPHAGVPSSQTCMSCHSQIKRDSPYLASVRDSFVSGNPVPWKRIHKVADFAFFNHAIHVQRGVGCVSCHGQVDDMAVVYHVEPLTMCWCLDCHRHPEKHLRPASEAVNMKWRPALKEGPEKEGESLQKMLKIKPPETCQGCHR